MRPLSERFWAKVDRRGPDECWPWLAFRTNLGYGKIGIGKRSEGKGFAHRIAWVLTNGEIPDGFYVCHHCDNPPCCNPAHLFLGTKRDNTLDMWSKGRGRVPASVRGAAHPCTRVTAEQASWVRAHYRWRDREFGIPALARSLRVGTTTIYRILSGRIYGGADATHSA